MRAPSTAGVRALIAVMVVGTFMVITAVIALFPLFSNTNVELTQYADFFVKTASVYTGIVGVIIGYYFARRTDAVNAKPAATKADDDRGAGV
jgi:ABC-type nickel/cobalt efflux system permease component RcnA